MTAAADADSPRGRRLFTLTALGKREWLSWMKEAPTEANPESTMLARVYRLGYLPQQERGDFLAALRTRVEEDASQLGALASHLEEVQVPRDSRDLSACQRATLDYGLRSHRLALEWLDELERT